MLISQGCAPVAARISCFDTVASEPPAGRYLFLLGIGLLRDPRWLAFSRKWSPAAAGVTVCIEWIHSDQTADPDTGEVRSEQSLFHRYYHVFAVQREAQSDQTRWSSNGFGEAILKVVAVRAGWRIALPEATCFPATDGIFVRSSNR